MKKIGFIFVFLFIFHFGFVFANDEIKLQHNGWQKGYSFAYHNGSYLENGFDELPIKIRDVSWEISDTSPFPLSQYSKYAEPQSGWTMKLESLRDKTQLVIRFLDLEELTGARRIIHKDDKETDYKFYIKSSIEKRDKILSDFLVKFELGEIKSYIEYSFEDGISITITDLVPFKPEVPASPSLWQRFWSKKSKPEEIKKEEIKKENIKIPCKLYLIESTIANTDLLKLSKKDFEKPINGVSKNWIQTKQVGIIGEQKPGIPISGYVVVQNKKTGAVLSVSFDLKIKNEKELQDLIKKAIEEYETDKSTNKSDKTKRK